MKPLVLAALLLLSCSVKCFDIVGNFSAQDAVESEPAGCDGSCWGPLLEAIELLVYSEKRTGAIGNLCRKYEESARCAHQMVGCRAYKTFNITTSGISYMCVEKKDTFEGLAGCIEMNFSRVKAECLMLCRPGSEATASTLQKMREDAPLRGFDMQMPAILAGEVCRMIRCVMDCAKRNFNARCEGSAGLLLAEVVVRPILKSQLSFVEMPLFGALAASLPVQCRFFSDEQAKATPKWMHEINVDFNPWKLEEYMSLDYLSPLEDNDALLEGRLQGMNISISMRHQNVSIQHADDEQAIEGSGTE
uniref:Chondroitin proteoglycan 4 domain-containing protein n=1 Tax=Parascaris univalens TaxID=6257 RepID=A0A915BC39_PARUN